MDAGYKWVKGVVTNYTERGGGYKTGGVGKWSYSPYNKGGIKHFSHTDGVGGGQKVSIL